MWVVSRKILINSYISVFLPLLFVVLWRDVLFHSLQAPCDSQQLPQNSLVFYLHGKLAFANRYYVPLLLFLNWKKLLSTVDVDRLWKREALSKKALSSMISSLFSLYYLKQKNPEYILNLWLSNRIQQSNITCLKAVKFFTQLPLLNVSLFQMTAC